MPPMGELRGPNAASTPCRSTPRWAGRGHGIVAHFGEDFTHDRIGKLWEMEGGQTHRTGREEKVYLAPDSSETAGTIVLRMAGNILQ